jgi:phage FluMu protein Com
MRGSGYLYIDQELVNFRKRYPSLESARKAMQQMQEIVASDGKLFYRLGPILVCEQGAKLRNLNLKVAAADARHWWDTGLVPLRVTPQSNLNINCKRRPAMAGEISFQDTEEMKCPRCKTIIDMVKDKVGEGGDAEMYQLMGLKQVRVRCPKCKTLMEVTGQ